MRYSTASDRVCSNVQYIHKEPLNKRSNERRLPYTRAKEETAKSKGIAYCVGSCRYYQLSSRAATFVN